MKLSVRVRGEWFAVPCKGTEQIKWLGEEALRRYHKLQPESTHVAKEESVFEIRKTRGGALLDPMDNIKAVLNDDDFVSVGGSRVFLLSFLLQCFPHPKSILKSICSLVPESL